MSDDSNTTSLTLLDRVQNDDDEAWHRFARLYGPIVYAWGCAAGLQPNDVEDVVQNVFAVVSRRLDKFELGRKPSGAFRSWLWGITRNSILQYLRDRKRQPVGKGGSDANHVLQRLESTEDEPESNDGMSIDKLMLHNAIEILKTDFDARTWQAFYDMAVKGRPAKDVGDELGMNAKAVRQAKFRVTKKLRELLGNGFPDLVRQFAGS